MAHGTFRILMITEGDEPVDEMSGTLRGVTVEWIRLSVGELVNGVLASHAGNSDPSLSYEIHEKEYLHAIERFVEALGTFHCIVFSEAAWERTDEYVLIYEALTRNAVPR